MPEGKFVVPTTKVTVCGVSAIFAGVVVKAAAGVKDVSLIVIVGLVVSSVPDVELSLSSIVNV